MNAHEMGRRLLSLPPDAMVVGVWFDETDIILAAEDDGITITRNEVEKVIENLERYHDAEYGITWGIIRDVINDVIAGRL